MTSTRTLTAGTGAAVSNAPVEGLRTMTSIVPTVSSVVSVGVPLFQTVTVRPPVMRV